MMVLHRPGPLIRSMRPRPASAGAGGVPGGEQVFYAVAKDSVPLATAGGDLQLDGINSPLCYCWAGAGWRARIDPTTPAAAASRIIWRRITCRLRRWKNPPEMSTFKAVPG